MKTLKKFPVLFLLCLLTAPFGILAQPNNYTFIDSLLDNITTSNYEKSMRSWEARQLVSPIDPRRNSLLLNAMKTNKDEKRIKALIIDLIRLYGLKPEHISGYVPFNELLDGDFKRWLDEAYEEYYPEFVRSHADRHEIISRLDKIYLKDQYVASLLTGLGSENKITQKDMKRALEKLHSENYWDLVELCKQIKRLPNSFDDGFNASGIVNLVLLHNSDGVKDLPRFHIEWNPIMPFLRMAYAEGKIDHSFVYIYDQEMKSNFECQYFGTYENLRALDPEGLEDRRIEYNIRKKR